MAEDTNLPQKDPDNAHAYSEEVLSKLEEIFKQDVSIDVASRYAGISPRTYHRWYNQFPEFADRMDRVRDFARVLAGNVVVQSIHKGDVNSAKWWLERKHGDEFGTKQDDRPNNTLNVFGDMSIENVVNLSHEQRQQRIAQIEEAIVSLESNGGD